MSFLSFLTGGSKAVDKGLDMVSKGLDMAVFTGEEKSIASQKILDWKLQWIKATGPQSVSRRVIAFMVVGLWVYLVLLGVHLYLLDMTTKSEFVFKVLKEIVNSPFLMVMGFFYLAHVVRANK